MNIGKRTKITLSVKYELEIELENNIELDTKTQEMVERYFPARADWPGKVQTLVNDEVFNPDQTLAMSEEAAIERTLKQTKGQVVLAAKILNIQRATLYAKMKRYGLIRETFIEKGV